MAFADHLLEDNLLDVAALRTAIAYQILTYQDFDARYWMQLHAANQLHASWLFHAAAHMAWDRHYVQAVVAFLKATGLREDVVVTLREPDRFDDQSVPGWVRRLILENGG
jgi:hypothetical protein